MTSRFANEKLVASIRKSLQDFDKIIDPAGPIGQKLLSSLSSVKNEALIELIIQIVKNEHFTGVPVNLTDSYVGAVYVAAAGGRKLLDGESSMSDQSEFFESVKNMNNNQFKIVAFSHDRDSISPFFVYLLWDWEPDIYSCWLPLGIPSLNLTMINEYGLFSNLESEETLLVTNDALLESATPEERYNYFYEQVQVFLNKLDVETGVLGFVLDFEISPFGFTECLNWNTLPKTLL
jgi:hypothetical protein